MNFSQQVWRLLPFIPAFNEGERVTCNPSTRDSPENPQRLANGDGALAKFRGVGSPDGNGVVHRPRYIGHGGGHFRPHVIVGMGYSSYDVE
jgi:hypothetical protein